MKYLELNFFTYYTVDAKRPKKLVNDVLHFFCTLSTQRNTVHFNYVPSVLELELCKGWKCTWCFVTMNFGFIFICVHFLKAFCYIEPIKSCLLPLLSNLYCRGWPLNRGWTGIYRKFWLWNFGKTPSSRQRFCFALVSPPSVVNITS